jgi:hypothetical protein
MKIITYIHDGDDGDILGQGTVERPLDGWCWDGRGGSHIYHLAESMHPGIRPASGDHSFRISQELVETLLKDTLHRPHVILHLPAHESGPVIGQGYLDISGQGHPSCITNIVSLDQGVRRVIYDY